jgi:hypothetical protein
MTEDNGMDKTLYDSVLEDITLLSLEDLKRVQTAVNREMEKRAHQFVYRDGHLPFDA